MKQILGLLLLVLVLCGCAAQPRSEATTLPPQTTAVPEAPTEPRGIYQPESDLEIQSGGAVQVYLPEAADSYGIRAINGDLLVFSGSENTVLTRYAGDNLFPVASCRLECRVSPEDTAFQISGNGITYFNPETREVVFLDNDLKEVSRLAMPEDLVGKPVLSSNRTKVYYCTADAIRVYEMETGLHKLLKSISYTHQSVEAVLARDSVLRCSLRDSQGQESAIFLSTQTGELLAQLRTTPRVYAGENHYFAVVSEGIAQQLVFSLGEGTQQALTPRDPDGQVYYLPDTQSVLTASLSGAATILDYYELSSGLRTASQKLPAGFRPWYVQMGTTRDFLFLMGYSEPMDQMLILRWQISASPVEDPNVYTGPRYTRENPDAGGLEDCEAYAREIGQTHGVQILIGEAAAAVQPWDYTLISEYQTGVLYRQLQRLEGLLSHFPQGFFEQIPGVKKICVVRSIVGNAESGSVSTAAGVQFWEGEETFIALAAGDTLEYAFFHELFHIIDSKVLSDSRVYYYWHNLNPQGFSYYENYTSYLTEDNSRYLREEDRAFIDAYSMCFPKEDRARIMEYACTDGNEEYFQSETMQTKLRTLCKGIREAFGLTDQTQTLLWEQYLKLQ